MKQFRVFLILLFSFCASCCFADDSWYLVAGENTMTVRGLEPPSRLEKVILGTPGIVGSSTTDSTSSFNSVGVGKCTAPYFCIEAVYLWGAKVSRTISIDSSNLGIISVGGVLVDTSQIPTLTLRQEATLSALQLSMLGKAPVTSWLDAFARFGLCDYRIGLVSSVQLYQNIALEEESEESGISPTLSLGFDVKPFDGVNVRVEGYKTKRASVFSVALVYKF
ncbi:MAG: hypothetical protein WC791_01085 [Candidatus Paceibacterota bacterium]|jgi:hypothetical protein